MQILIVDDSRAMRLMVRRALRQAGFGDHTITEAEDGAQAFNAITASPPDLVLCDWNMPNLTGIELLEQLTAAEVPVKFGFVTSETTVEMRNRATSAGALFLISKPFTPEVFERTLSEVFG